MNMRKIVAIMASVLMLFSVIPMGALTVSAAPGDVILDKDFNDGTNGGFERSVNEDGVLVFDASTGDWQNTYLGGVNGFQKNVDYVVTFKAKADRNTNMNFKVVSDWAYDSAAFTVDVTTEWQEYENTINMSELGWAIVMFSSNADAANGATYYIDDLKIAEYKAPVEVGKVTNGDFENGSEGWKLNASASIENGALKLDNSGQWAEAAMTDIVVEVGTEYVLSWKSQRISGNGAYLMFVLKSDLSNHGTTGTNWMNNTSSDWIEQEIKFVASEANLKLKISPEVAEPGVILIDDIKLTALKAPSDDGFIKNGDFETGDGSAWTLYSGTAVADYAAKNGEYGLHIKNPTGGWGGTAFQDFTVEVGKSYEVTMWAKTLAGSRGQNIQIQNGGTTPASKWFDNHTEWTLLTFEFTAIAASVRINICGGGTYANEEIYVDDIKVVELKQPSYDGYITNGDFETGEVFPWDNLWGSCPTVEVIEGGKDSDYALNVVSGKWKHVRQTAIAVQPNTWYKVTAWAKNASDMVLLVKDGGDSKNLNTTGMNAGDEWTEFTGVFNTGDYTSILVSLMGGENDEIAEKYGTFDNISMEITEAPHEHDFQITENSQWPTCEEAGWVEYACECGETYTEELPAYHNGGLEYTAAVEAIDCANPGNVEYWFCPGCYEYFADAEATEYLNPWFIEITIDCVRPEGIADCATVTCETCGNDIYGYGEHDVLACQGGTCSKCNAEIEGYGCQNYDTPACQDGVCYYCGGFVAGFGHENGAWAPCCDGECAYGCGLIYPATEDHVDEDGNDYCDNCWSHLAHIDEDGNGECDVCLLPMPVADVVYGDADGDGEVTLADASLVQQFVSGGEVTVFDGADADGDGEITLADASLVQQFVSGYDVTLGG